MTSRLVDSDTMSIDQDGARGRAPGDAHIFDKAIHAMRNKKPVPETDFTLHTMEDGTEVSTQERVCKGKLE
jgi:serine/threonine-protein phosphatase 2B catalytic subunit